MKSFKESGNATRTLHDPEDIEVIYRCPECGEEHETKAAARKCCSRWVCSCCDTEHDTKQEAKDCCSVWVCGICGQEFDEKEEAEECCVGRENSDEE